MKTSIIIPARYASTRLPGKPLIKIGGKSIIQWVYEKATLMKLSLRLMISVFMMKLYHSADWSG